MRAWYICGVPQARSAPWAARDVSRKLPGRRARYAACFPNDNFLAFFQGPWFLVLYRVGSTIAWDFHPKLRPSVSHWGISYLGNPVHSTAERVLSSDSPLA